MKYNHRNFSTPMIMASGLVITVSGIMMFFHLEKDLVKLMHEWIGLVMAVGVLLHIQFHWRAFKGYFTKKIGHSCDHRYFTGQQCYRLNSTG